MEIGKVEILKNILFKLEQVESNEDLTNVENAIDSCLIVQQLKNNVNQKTN